MSDDLDARIDALHGPGAAEALDAAIADGSIFNDIDCEICGFARFLAPGVLHVCEPVR